VLLAGAASVLAGCASNDATRATRIRPGGMLAACVAGDPDSLDPQRSSLAVSATVYSGLFSRLVTLRQDGTFAPELATSWSRPDERTHVFDLRPGVVFHNGDPLTPEDVVFTFDRITAKESTYAGDFSALSGVEKTGPAQVTFHLDRPFAPLLANVANRGHILSRRAVDAEDPRRHPVGTGPFALGEWNQGMNVKLVHNKDYFGGRPLLDAVNFTFLPHDYSRVLALRAGQLDWVDGVPPQSVSEVRGDRSLTYVTSSVAGRPQFLLFNTTRPPLDNKALRQAICWAIDRDEIAKVGFFGIAEPGSQEFGQDSFWHTDDSDPYATAPDPRMVRAKLAEAGLPRGGVHVRFLAWNSAADSARTAQVIRQRLEPFGIHLDIEVLDTSTWINRLFAKDYELTLAFQEQLVDPDNFWSLLWTSEAEQNVTGYRNPAVDALVKQAAATTDQNARREHYARIRRMVLADAPTLFTAYTPIGYATRASVLGSRVSPTQDPELREIGLG
jgi:peptide/nickel transport system substrate-binding protein